eukprot:4016856-Alexandrium_andersonii.AAC.1
MQLESLPGPTRHLSAGTLMKRALGTLVLLQWKAELARFRRPTTNVWHHMWVSAAPRWQRWAAVSCPPPP